MYSGCYWCVSRLLNLCGRTVLRPHSKDTISSFRERWIFKFKSNRHLFHPLYLSTAATDRRSTGDNTVVSKHESLEIKSKRTSYYIVNEKLANSVASTVFEHSAFKKCLLIEANPGPGVLTTAFFNAGFHHIVGLESRKEFLPYLQVVQCEVGDDQLQYYLFDLFTLWQREVMATACDVKYRETETDIVNHLNSQNITQDDPVCVFGTLSSNKEYHFLAYLVQQFMLQEGLFSVGQFHWYLFVSAKVYRELLTCRGDIQSVMFYNKLGIILYNLFDFKFLMEVPNNQFSPPFHGKRKTKLLNSPDFDINRRYLLQLTPKQNVDEILAPHEVSRFMSFLKQLLFKKSVRLIPRLEQLIPGCGVHLIKLRYTMTQSVVEMSPQQMLQLYKAMQQWPEYPDSPMHFHLSGRLEVGLEEDESQDMSGAEATNHQDMSVAKATDHQDTSVAKATDHQDMSEAKATDHQDMSEAKATDHQDKLE